MALGEASCGLIPGQLLGARVCTMGPLSVGCARARQPRSVRHGQRTHSVLEEHTQTPTWCPGGWAALARLWVLMVGLEDAPWSTLVCCGPAGTCGGLPECRGGDGRLQGSRPGGFPLGSMCLPLPWSIFPNPGAFCGHHRCPSPAIPDVAGEQRPLVPGTELPVP